MESTLTDADRDVDADRDMDADVDMDADWLALVGRRLRLAHRVFRAHPAMPATALWRIYEAELFQERLQGAGRGLDLGCGDGSFASVILPQIGDVRWTGLEVDAFDAELARRRGLYAEVVVQRAEDLASPDASFDLVVSNCVMEHLVELDGVLSQVGRTLKPGGRFVFTVPREDFHDQLLLPRLLRALGLARAAERYCRHIDVRLENVNLLSSDEWARRLSAAGLRIRDTAPYATRWTTGWWELLATATGGLAYLLARGRQTPRKIQQGAGLLERDRSWLGSVVFVLLFPVILLTAIRPTREPCAARYVEAIKEGPAP